MKGIISNPNIAPHVKESVLAYHEAGLLEVFYTSFFEHSQYRLTNILGLVPNLKREFKRRSFEELPYHLIKAKPLKELLRVFASRKLSPILTDKIWEWSELSFDKWVASNIKRDLSFIHVTEHAALATLKKARQFNVFSFYEQPSIHHQSFTEIVKNQILKYPVFKTEATSLLHNETAARRNKRRDEELRLANKIICNSTFTKNSLIKSGITPSAILTIPLGFPLVCKESSTQKQEKIIFMYAGNLSLGKGSHILLQAWKELKINDKHAELWLVGKNHLPKIFLEGLGNNVKFFGNIPRTDLMKMYQNASVFVHPTLADGFGMVITEAMSSGLPVIATYNCAGPDIIDHQKNGLLIPADDVDSLKNMINWCLSNQSQLIEMGVEAKQKASSYSWADYRKNLVEQVIANLS